MRLDLVALLHVEREIEIWPQDLAQMVRDHPRQGAGRVGFAAFEVLEGHLRALLEGGTFGLQGGLPNLEGRLLRLRMHAPSTRCLGCMHA